MILFNEKSLQAAIGCPRIPQVFQLVRKSLILVTLYMSMPGSMQCSMIFFKKITAENVRGHDEFNVSEMEWASGNVQGTLIDYPRPQTYDSVCQNVKLEEFEENQMQ